MMINLVAAIALLYFGREVFVPVGLAFILATLLRPVVRWFETRGLPSAAGAAIVIATGLLMVFGIGYALTPALQRFGEQLPEVAQTASTRLRALPPPLNRLGGAVASGIAQVEPSKPADRVKPSADSAGASPHPDSAKAAASNAHPAASRGAPSSGSGMSTTLPIAQRIFGTAAGFLSSLVEIVLLLAFFLAAGSQVRERLLKVARGSPLARGIVDVGDEVGSVVSRYLSLLALINLGQGILITIAMMAIGMPAPPVWGALAFVAEFFPYLGGATMVVLLTLVGLAGSSGGGHLLLAPVIYVVVTTLQNSLVSPVTYGRSLKLNPAMILISVMTWWLLWGVIGAFLAVPILATLKIVCDRQKGSLAAVGALIEG